MKPWAQSTDTATRPATRFLLWSKGFVSPTLPPFGVMFLQRKGIVCRGASGRTPTPCVTGRCDGARMALVWHLMRHTNWSCSPPDFCWSSAVDCEKYTSGSSHLCLKGNNHRTNMIHLENKVCKQSSEAAKDWALHICVFVHEEEDWFAEALALSHARKHTHAHTHIVSWCSCKNRTSKYSRSEQLSQNGTLKP